MANLFNLIFGSTLKKILIIGLGGLALICFFQVRSCQKAKEQIKAYKQAEKIRKQDKKTDEKIEDFKQRIENFTPQQLEDEFEKLREYRK